jgi:hypothetical protein
MDKLWHILTQTYLPFIVKFVENIYMILKNIMVKVKNVFFSRLHQYPEEPSFFMRYYPMVRSTIDCLSQRFSKNVFHRSEVPDMSVDELQLWNCFSYYPAVTHFDFLGGQRGKFFGKNKKEYPGNYLFTVDWGHPDTNILDVDHSEIPQEHKCAHIFWSLATAIMLLSLIIGSFGIFLVILLKSISQTIKYKLRIGT